MFESLTDGVRSILLPFLASVAALLGGLVVHILVLHSVRSVRYHRRQRQLTRYRPVVESALYGPGSSTDACETLGRIPRRHRGVVAALILEPLRVAGGAVVARAGEAASAAGLDQQWKRQLEDPRWWRRAEAMRALALIGCADIVPRCLAALDDDDPDVRAAAVEGLGHLRAPHTIPALVACLGQPRRYPYLRIAGALERFGAAAVPALLHHARRTPDDQGQIIDLLGTIGAAAAIDSLIEWTGDDDAGTRAGALRAIGLIGVDERAYYHVLRALADADATVRAAAAWAAGRSGKSDAARYVAPLLDDDWNAGAQAARALRTLGAAGRRELEAAVRIRNSAVARQALWEQGVQG